MKRRVVAALLALLAGACFLWWYAQPPLHPAWLDGGGRLHAATASPPAGATGLDFPGNLPSTLGNTRTIRFRWTEPPAIYPATYLWRYHPRRQRFATLSDPLYRKPYYTTFFWGNDTPSGLNGTLLGTFKWDGGVGASYYGAHPYPYARAGDGWAEAWEISVLLDDYTVSADGTRADVVYDRWYDQAFVAWREPLTGRKRHRFYWDLPHTDPAHYVDHTTPASWGETRPPFPVLTFGDAPWAPGGEVMSRVLRGIKVYTAALSPRDILDENRAALSTGAGAASIWYLNENPTPDDISDRSGKGHEPEWVGSLRPALWRR